MGFKLCFWIMLVQQVGYLKGNWTYPSKWLCHLPQEVLGKLHCLINGQVKAAICDVFLNPAGKFTSLVSSGVTLRMGTRGLKLQGN